MINMMNETFRTDAELSGINLSLGALSVAQAEQQQNTSWFTTGALSKRVLPLLRSILEGLLYGIFPFVFILFLLPNGFKYILAYLTNLFWIQSWGFFFVVLNLGINIAAKRDISAITDGLGFGIALINHANLYYTSADFINMSGAMAIAIPLLSLGIITGSGYAVVNSIGTMTSTTEGVANTSGSTVGMGNLSYGNMSANNESYDNIGAHGQNTAWTNQTGGHTNLSAGSSINEYGVGGNPAVSHHTGTGAINVSNASAITRAYNHSVGQIESGLHTDTQTLQNRFGSMVSDMGSYAHSSQTGSSKGTAENSGRQLSYSDMVQDATNTIRTEGMDEKVVKDRANQVLGAAAASVMLLGNGVKGQQSVNFKGNELDAYNKAVSAMESIGASKIFQDMETYSKTDSIGTTNSESHAYTNNRSAAFNEANELLGSMTDSYSKLSNIQDQYNEMRRDDFGVTTQLTGDFNDWYREKYGDSTDKYYEGMTDNKTGEQLVYEYMSDRVFNGEERFGAGPGIGAKEQAMDAGLDADSGIEGVQFKGDVKPNMGMNKDGIEGIFTEENNKLSKAYSSGGQAFYIEPKAHTEAIQNKEARLDKEHKDHKEVAGFNEAINRYEIDAKESEVRYYKDNIMSEEIGKPLGLDKIREEVNDHANDPSWGAHKTEKKLPGTKDKKDKK